MIVVLGLFMKLVLEAVQVGPWPG